MPRRPRTSTLLLPALALGLALPTAARADQERRLHVALHHDVWAEISLPQAPWRLITLDVPTRPAYFAGVSFNVVAVRNFVLPLGLFDLHDNDIEFEAQLLKHHGLQSHVEGTLAWVIRSGERCAWGACVAFAFSEGGSYAFADPVYEKGITGVRGQNTVRFQHHMAFELEWTARALPDFHFLTRLHHRSGIYGVISPQKTGSNYIGVGLRYDVW